MIPSLHQLRLIAGHDGVASNGGSVIAGLKLAGAAAGLDHPADLAQYLAQIMHETGGLRFDREIWGPTPAQARYDTRTDLGNTPVIDGDGELYCGRSPFQITGLANYTALRNWCRARWPRCPDFVADPDALLTDPWEGLAPIWYWTTRDLGRYADAGDIEMITRRINGGLNGYPDRLRYYTRAALVLLGYAPDAVAGFQTNNADLVSDGIAGPRTRRALHMALLQLGEGQAPADDLPLWRRLLRALRGDRAGVAA